MSSSRGINLKHFDHHIFLLLRRFLVGEPRLPDDIVPGLGSQGSSGMMMTTFAFSPTYVGMYVENGV